MKISSIRTFISIEPDFSTKERIKDFISRQRTNSDFINVRWVKPQNTHITLAFLGNISKNIIPTLRKELKDVASLYSAFKINLSDIGGFPNIYKPRVLWIGIEDNPDLVNLKKDIDKKLQKIGLKFDTKSFLPHITIGRWRNTTFNSSKKSNFRASFIANKINLVKSELTKSGPLYSIIFSEYFKDDNLTQN